MRVRRSELDSDYVQLPNATARDRHLSYKARGILVHVLSQKSGWAADAESLAEASDKDGRAAVLTGLKELERTGYLIRTRVQGERGRWSTESVIYDRPQPAANIDPNQLELASPQVGPKAGFPTVGRPNVGAPNAGQPNAGSPNVGPPAAKRGKTEEKTEGGNHRARAGDTPSPAPKIDPTHGGRHPAGNPADVGCRACGVERAAAAAEAEAAAKRREQQAIEAARAERTAALAAGTPAPPASRIREIAAAERAARAAHRPVPLSGTSGG